MALWSQWAYLGPILGRPSTLVSVGILCPTSLSSYISGSFLLPLFGSHVTFSPCSFSAIFGYPFLGSSSVLAEQRFSLSRICFPELQEKSRATGNSHAIDFSMAALHNILNTSPVCKLVCLQDFLGSGPQEYGRINLRLIFALVEQSSHFLLVQCEVSDCPLLQCEVFHNSIQLLCQQSHDWTFYVIFVYLLNLLFSVPRGI
jgi:hypothetical protein